MVWGGVNSRPYPHAPSSFLLDRRSVVASLCALALGRRAVAADAPPLLVIAHPDVGEGSLSRNELALIYTRSIEERRGIRLRPFNLAARSPERVEFDLAVLGLDPDRAAQLWIDKRVRGDGEPPRQVPSARSAAALAAAMPGAICYVPEGQPVDLNRVRLVARIRNGKVLAP